MSLQITANQNFQVYKRGTTELQGSAGTTVRVYHNLGYVPCYMAYAKEIDSLPAASKVLPDDSSYYILPVVFGVEDLVTDTYIEFETRAGVNNRFKIAYIIFREDAK